MTAVTAELGAVPEEDVQAIATYIASLMPPPAAAPSAPEPKRHDADPQAAALFAGACGGCHGADAPMRRTDGVGDAVAPSLALSTAVNAPTPLGVAQIILHGIPWREGTAAPYMPAFASALTDQQVAALAGYLRATYSDKPAWSDVAAAVTTARNGGGT
jgi:mono/diheme cytochrome c family protein